MEEVIEQIKKNKTWTLVSRLVDKNVIGTKWVFKNKLDENGEIIGNKGFKVYQMDVKSTFLNEILEKEVYIEQLRVLLMRPRIRFASYTKLSID